MRSAPLRRLAMLLAGLASFALAHACASAQQAPPEAPAATASLGIRLADGTVVRIPCFPDAPACASATESPATISGPRRALLKRGAQIFDKHKPGVVASIRG